MNIGRKIKTNKFGEITLFSTQSKHYQGNSGNSEQVYQQGYDNQYDGKQDYYSGSQGQGRYGAYGNQQSSNWNYNHNKYWNQQDGNKNYDLDWDPLYDLHFAYLYV
jgi:hypothetical protein